MNKNKLVAFVQEELNARYGLNLEVDGYVGPVTIQALDRVTAIPAHFTKGKRFVAFIQYLTHVEPAVEDIVVDGLVGPATENAIEQLKAVARTGKPNYWRDNIDGYNDAQMTWPTYENIRDIFGEPGTRLSRVHSPYPLKLAWDTDRIINSFKCHELIVDPVREAMENILDVYGTEIPDLGIDLFGGCYNFRKMKGGSKLSTHAWACAIDWAPATSRLRWDHTKAQLARPEYNDFWNIWEATGAVSLGRSKLDMDWMHLQYVRL